HPVEEISMDIGTEGQVEPSIAVEAGKVHIVWEDRRAGVGPADIYHRYFDGIGWQPVEDVSADLGMNQQMDASVAVDGDMVHVVWTDQRGGDYDIYYRGGETEDLRSPESNTDLISPYWQTATTFDVEWTATDDSDLASISLFYKYSSDNSSWLDWEEWAYDNTISGTFATGSFPFSSPHGDSYYEFYTIARDASGNNETAPILADSIVGVDTTRPTGSIIIDNGEAWTTTAWVSLTLMYSDLTSGVSQVRYSNDGVWDTESWESPSPAKEWPLTSGDGTKTVYYQIIDNVGWLSITYSDDIGLDTTEPTGSIVINYGEAWTNSTSVTLGLTYYDDLSGVSEVRYSNDGIWDTEVWRSPSTTKSLTLESGDGIRIVYYQVKDNAGLESITYLDYIGLDTVPPTGSIIINNGDIWTTSTSVTLTLTYSDSFSGVFQVRYSNDGIWDIESWESPSATKEWTLTDGEGTKAVYYQVRDNAGLLSPTYSDNIELDTTPPTIVSIMPSDGSTDVEITTEIKVTFSEKMDRLATTSSFGLKKGDTEIEGRITWTTDGKTLFFIPKEDLEYETTYQIIITTSAKDVAGNNLLAASETSFTTKGVEEKPEEEADIVKDYWWIILVLVIVTIIVALAAWKRRRRPQFEEEVPAEKEGTQEISGETESLI
ncbi:MAG: Ig-like domain-containing protein, partial [Thermoplasmata archaeon]|nr:Ig-like domain-containing protein [Thermoplasmata archaeon]